MLLQWVLLWNTEKDRGAKRQRSIICKVQTSRASEGLHWVCLVIEKGGLVGCMPVIGVRGSIYLPAHTALQHRLCFLHSAVAKLTFWQLILLYHQNVTGCLSPEKLFQNGVTPLQRPLTTAHRLLPGSTFNLSTMANTEVSSHCHLCPSQFRNPLLKNSLLHYCSCWLATAKSLKITWNPGGKLSWFCPIASQLKSFV